MRTRPANSTEAETYGICNSVQIAINKGLIQPGDHVLIQCDSMGSLQALRGDRPHLSGGEREAVEWFKRLLNSVGFTFDTRHVKGHTGETTGRHGANEHCDKRAKKHMKQKRDKIRLEKVRRDNET